MLLKKSNVSQTEVKEIMANLEPLQGNFDQLVYSLENFTSEFDVPLAQEGATTEKSKLPVRFKRVRQRFLLICPQASARIFCPDKQQNTERLFAALSWEEDKFVLERMASIIKPG